MRFRSLSFLFLSCLFILAACDSPPGDSSGDAAARTRSIVNGTTSAGHTYVGAVVPAPLGTYNGSESLTGSAVAICAAPNMNGDAYRVVFLTANHIMANVGDNVFNCTELGECLDGYPGNTGKHGSIKAKIPAGGADLAALHVEGFVDGIEVINIASQATTMKNSGGVGQTLVGFGPGTHKGLLTPIGGSPWAGDGTRREGDTYLVSASDSEMKLESGATSANPIYGAPGDSGGAHINGSFGLAGIITHQYYISGPASPFDPVSRYGTRTEPTVTHETWINAQISAWCTPTETQTPPTETQTPPTETQTPPTETQTPPTETQTPPTETQTPPTETQTLPMPGS